MRDFYEASKYLWIKESNPKLTIRFILANPDVKAYPQTKMKLGDWLTKHGFEWAVEGEIPEEWK